MEGFRHVQGFLAEGEAAALAALVDRHDGLFRDVHGKGGLGPKYRVIDGDQILAELPEVAALGDGRVRPLAEDFAGHRWIFSETLRDVAPEEWGGRSIQP